MIKKLRPVLGVGGRAEDVHHHEVLDVVLFSPWLLQLVDIVPGLLKIKCQRYHKLYCQREVNCSPSGVAPNLHFPHLHQTQIYKTHIYTKPRFTQTQIYTTQIYTHTQIYTAPYWHTQIYTPKIYTKINPNLQRHKFTFKLF